MTDSIKIMINVVEKHAVNNTEANFYELFQALTLDVIGNNVLSFIGFVIESLIVL